MSNNPPLITVNVQDVVDDKAAVALTEAGQKVVAAQSQAGAGASNPAPATNGAASFAIISGAQLPAAKRGGGGGRGGAPVKYPFDQLEVNQSFFVPNSAVKNGDAAKSLGSTVSSMNLKYTQETGEQETVTRTKRGAKNKAVLDTNGNKVKEEITRVKRVPVRKFTVRAVEAGKQYGSWTADQSGALIQRTM